MNAVSKYTGRTIRHKSDSVVLYVLEATNSRREWNNWSRGWIEIGFHSSTERGNGDPVGETYLQLGWENLVHWESWLTYYEIY